jgi:hypothetical protein
MLKKVTAKQDKKIEAAARAQFATDINELYRARMAGQPATHPDPEVRAVAFGLVAFKQAIKPFLHKYRNDPEALAATGVIVADEIINTLTTTGRRDHPLWKHIDALQTSMHLATPGANVQRIREMFSGVVLAYQEKITGGKQWPAARAVCEGINAADFPYNAGQLRQWARQNDGRKYAKQFLRDAAIISFDVPGRYSEAERILIAGREALYPLLVIPS